jgi:23S rRNA (guanosine2251-2'-O)-methyltransferase
LARERDSSARRRGTSTRRGQSREFIHGLHAISEALSAQRRDLHALWLAAGPNRPELEDIAAKAQAAGVTIRTEDADRLASRIKEEGARIQGALLEAGPLPELPGIGPLLDEQPAGPVRIVVLDGVEDPQNVGAIARVADAAGAGGLLMTQRRAPPLSPAVSRASAGAIEWLPVARVANLARALEGLKAKGLWVVGADLEATEDLFGVPDRVLSGNLAVVVGAEGKGLRASTRALVDHPIRIPMSGRVASLNVATATAVVLFEILRRSGGAEEP